MTFGIDVISCYTAPLYLTIDELAAHRGIEADKLKLGLGLTHMTLPDVDQDVVVLGANALSRLIDDHTVELSKVDRIYVGTESGIDASKPVASFLLGLMEQRLGVGVLSHVDAVDFTFACIGGVDALQNCLDYVRLNPTRQAIVVTTDIAKYDLGSSGEYTQGAGALAMLVSANPKLIEIGERWATDTQSVFDFFKPMRTISKADITGAADNPEWFGQLEAEIEIHKDQPVFDGRYSNQCYTDRTRNAYFGLKRKLDYPNSLYESWHSIIMHLPYAFQGRRMLPEIFALDGEYDLDREDAGYAAALKDLSKSTEYKKFVAQKLQPAEAASSLAGNFYTGSIFLGLLSALSIHAQSDTELAGEKFGFMAYGSGSKAKVFEGTIAEDWREVINKTNLFAQLEQGTRIDFKTYEALHKKERKQPVRTPHNEWVLHRIETEIPTLIGARYYRWID